MASDDNSEFWLSPNESPAGAQLVAFVGKVPPLPRRDPSPALHPHLPLSPLGVLWPPSRLLQLLRDGVGWDGAPKDRGTPSTPHVAPQTGSEWTAPGEFTKFSSQTSKPRR